MFRRKAQGIPIILCAAEFSLPAYHQFGLTYTYTVVACFLLDPELELQVYGRVGSVCIDGHRGLDRSCFHIVFVGVDDIET